MTDSGEATPPDENVRSAPGPGGRSPAESAVQPAGGVVQPAETTEVSLPSQGYDPGRMPPPGGGPDAAASQVLEGRIVEPYVRGHLPAPVPAAKSRLTPVLLSTIVVLLLVVAALLVIIITKPTGTTTTSGSASPSGRITPTAPGRQSPTDQQTPSQTPATSTPPSAGPSAGPSGGSGAPTAAAGPPSTLLGSYEINLSLDYSVPLGPNKPGQADFNQGNQGDLRLNNFAGSITLMPLNGLKMVTLNQGTKPTYDLCKADTLFAGSEPPTARTSFCMFGGGTMIGVYVASVANTNAIANVDHVVLDVTVWQDDSPGHRRF